MSNVELKGKEGGTTYSFGAKRRAPRRKCLQGPLRAGSDIEINGGEESHRLGMYLRKEVDKGGTERT